MRFKLFKSAMPSLTLAPVLLILAMTVVSACGFLNDNKAPSLVYQVEKAIGSTATCNFRMLLQTEAMNANALCAQEFVSKIFDKVHTFRANELQDFEIQALLNHFVKSDDEGEFSLSDVRGLIKIKVAFLGGSQSAVERSLIENFLKQMPAANQLLEDPRLYENNDDEVASSENRGSFKFFQKIGDLTLGTARGEGFLTASDLRGCLHFAQRIKAVRALKIFSNLNDKNADLLLQTLVVIHGYRADSALPLTALRSLPTLFRDARAVFDEKRSIPNTVDGLLNSAVVSSHQRMREKIGQFIEDFAVSSAYSKNGIFSKEQLKKLLDAFQHAELYDGQGQLLKVNFNSEENRGTRDATQRSSGRRRSGRRRSSRPAFSQRNFLSCYVRGYSFHGKIRRACPVRKRSYRFTRNRRSAGFF